MTAKWPTVPFGQLLAEPVRNGIYKSKEFHGRGAKIVNMGELFAFPRLRAVPMKRVELTESEGERFSLSKGDLIFARRSLVAEGAGKCSVVLDVDEPTTFESSIIRARPDSKKADSLFLYYFFNSRNGLHCLDTIRRQVAVAGITGSDLSRLEIPLPSPQEQRTIAKILSDLDEKIELNHRMNKTLESIAQAIFKRWFVNFEFPDEKGKPYKSSGGKMVESELGEIPKRWETKAIGEVVQVVGGSTPSTKNPDFWDGGIYWATPKDLASLPSEVLLDTERKITDMGLREIGSGLLPAGTVLLSSRAPIGYVAVAEVPVAINQGFIGIICSKTAPTLFIKEWVKENMEVIKGRANGTTFLEISKSNFRPMPIVIPNGVIVSQYSSIVERLYSQVVANLKQARAFTEIRDCLLPKLMSGEIRVGV